MTSLGVVATLTALLLAQLLLLLTLHLFEACHESALFPWLCSIGFHAFTDLILIDKLTEHPSLDNRDKE